MRVWGVRNLLTKIFLFTLLVHFYVGAESTLSDVEDAEDEDEAALSMDEYGKTLQDNYQNGFVQMIRFFDSMTESLGKINQGIWDMGMAVKLGQEERKKEIESVTENFSKIDQRIGSIESALKDGQAELKREIASAKVCPREDNKITVYEVKMPAEVSPETKPYQDCGGFVAVVPDVPATIRYPKKGNYSKKERCVWTITPQVKFASYRIKVQSFGMEKPYAGVKINYWNSTAEFQSIKVMEFGSWISIHAPYVIITFCSYTTEKVGGGFGASIVGLGTSSDTASFKPIWITSPYAHFSYPVGNSSIGSAIEMVSVVVQPPHLQNAKVTINVPQIGNDIIKPYTLSCHHDHAVGGYLIGRSGDASSSLATYQYGNDHQPGLVIFKSNGGNGGVQFTISY